MTDSTLPILLPGIPARIAGEQVEVRPVVLRELRLVERVMEGWSVLVLSGGSTVLPEAWEAFLGLLAGSVGWDRKRVEDQGPEDFEALVCLALAINKDLWDPPETSEVESPFTWAQIIQRLVRSGHTRESIMEMTLPQAKAFLEESLRAEREDLALDITAASFSMADGETVKKVTQELRRV